MALEPGDAAPDFTLADQRGNPVKLSDLWAQTVVLYFYPKAEARARDTFCIGPRRARRPPDESTPARLRGLRGRMPTAP
jgi:hypothetical protein